MISAFIHKILRRVRTLLRPPSEEGTSVRMLKYAPSTRKGSTLALSFVPLVHGERLPVPPENLWLGYGANEHEYIESGRKDTERMLEILAGVGFDMKAQHRPVLDLGCGGGRMIRQLEPLRTLLKSGVSISALPISTG